MVRLNLVKKIASSTPNTQDEDTSVLKKWKLMVGEWGAVIKSNTVRETKQPETLADI